MSEKHLIRLNAIGNVANQNSAALPRADDLGQYSITASKNLSVTHHFIIILTTVHMQGCVEIMLDSLLML